MKKNLLTSLILGSFAMSTITFGDAATTQQGSPAAPTLIQPVSPSNNSQTNQPTSNPNPKSQWQTYSYAGNGFSISLPASPEATHQELALPNSQLKIPYDIYVSDPTDKVSYLVGVAKYPPEINVTVPENNLKAAVNGTLGSTPGGKLISSDATHYLNYPAIDFSIEGGNYNMRGRYILVGHTLYQLMVAFDKSTAVDPDYSTFIDSFKLMH